MKKYILIKILGVLFLAFIAKSSILAQSGLGEIRGKVTTSVELDQDMVSTGKVLLFLPDGSRVKSVFIEVGGNYYIKSVSPGEYFLKAILDGYDTAQTEVFSVQADKISDFNLGLVKTSSEPVVGDKISVVEKVILRNSSSLGREDNGAPPIDADQILKGGSRSPGAIITGTIGGVNTDAGGGISFVGSRTDGTAIMVDGVRVRSGSNVNTQSLGQVNVIIGGVPAQYGDFTGGAISYTTKGISNKHSKSVELLSSSPFHNNHSNTLEVFANGPLYIKNKGADANDTNVEQQRTILGYLFSGSATYAKDPGRSYIGWQRINAEKLAEIEKNPLVANENGLGFISAGNFVTGSDIETVQTRSNAAYFSATGQGKIDWAPNKNSLVTFYGSYRYQDFLNAGRQLFTYKTNARTVDQDILAYVKFRQDLPSPSNEAMLKKTTLSKAWYNIRVDYQQSHTTVRDQTHLNNVFDYGYIGKFTKYPTAFYNYVNNNNNPFAEQKMFIDQNGDTMMLREYYDQLGFVDTALQYQRSEVNSVRANYTSNIYSLLNERGVNITDDASLQSVGGILNGFGPPNVYGLWASPGSVVSGFSKSQNEFLSVFAMGEASLSGPLEKDLNRKPHDLQFGLFFEQSSYNSYFLNASELWRLMPQLTNSHILQLDKSNPILTYNSDGVFTDTVKYNRLIQADQQTTFDKNLRASLINSGAKDVYGNPIGERTFIDINSLTPDQFNVNMFSAQELINNNPYVNYSGYDYTGKRVRGKSSLNDFLNDENKRAVNGFQPIYTAAWIQDKFDFKDLIFRVGLRVERFDANQLVLKDPYSLYPVKTAAEVKDMNGVQVKHPDGIGEDFKVYVNDVNNPTKILGYRDNDQWYDNTGKAVTNPEASTLAATSNGKIAPFLVDPKDQELSQNSFEDYKPQVNILPRVWFSFPINTSALFFANYDVLAQRPLTGANFATVDDYFFMEARNSQTFANPALTPRIKTNYEIGFRQVLAEQRRGEGVAAILGITASYSEIRNDINLFFYNQAYPISYTSYTNIDFSTIKSFRSDIQIKMDKTLTLNGNYSLLFANGTGSNANSARALIASNQPNLRSLFPLGDLDIRHSVKANLNYDFGGGINPRTGKSEYMGPEKYKKYMEFASAGLIFTGLSGLPYTATTQPVAIGTTDRSPIKGDPFGSRLPWTFNMDLQLSKGFNVDYAGHQKHGVLYTFIIISNLLNTQNIVGVWPYTGEAQDDGFLSSPRGQQAIASQTNAASYTALYKVINNNPGFYRGPRYAQLGVRFQF